MRNKKKDMNQNMSSIADDFAIGTTEPIEKHESKR